MQEVNREGSAAHRGQTLANHPPGAPLHHGGPPGAASSPGSGTPRWKPHDPNGLGATLNVKAAEKEI